MLAPNIDNNDDSVGDDEGLPSPPELLSPCSTSPGCGFTTSRSASALLLYEDTYNPTPRPTPTATEMMATIAINTKQHSRLLRGNNDDDCVDGGG